MKPTTPTYIPTLDGWRAVAILLVLFEHASYPVFRPVGWTQLGAHGVEIFFVISGYLITGKLLEDNSLRKFYLRRIFRILPVLFAYLGVVFLLGIGLRRIPMQWSEIAASALFVRNYCNYPLMATTGAGWFTGHLWSLSIEEQFYLVWPLVLLKVGRKIPLRQMVAAFCLFALGCALWGVVVVARSVHLGGWHWLPNLKFAGLVFGCLMRIAFASARGAATMQRMFEGRSLLIAAAMAAYFVAFHDRVTIFDPAICALALCGTLANPQALVGKFLELAPLRWIGRLSYSLYVWQQLFLGFGVVYKPLGVISAFPLNIFSVVVAACASYYLLEKPFMRWGHSLTAETFAARSPQELRNVA